jgi:hypothetical protein
LTWDYGNGLATVDTPQAQAAAGFLKLAGPITLGDLTIESSNEYGQVAVVALDGRPIARSRRLLIQAVTEERMFGTRTENGVIQSVGRPPWNVKRIDATVTLRLNDTPLKRVVALDGNGEATADPVDFKGGQANQPLVIQLPGDRLYTLIER